MDRLVKWFFPALLCLLILLSTVPARGKSRVMLIPVTGEIQLGLSPFVERMTEEADREGYDLIIYEINTFGGRLDAAVVIRDAIINSRVPTVAFINKRAISAGVLISLAANRIYMHPQSTIGAAEPVSIGLGLKSGEVSEKVVSYWRAELRSTADKNNRPGEIAEAFADKSISIEGVVEEGKLLTLTAKQAIELKVADFQAETVTEILKNENLANAKITVAGMNLAEKVAGFLTQAIVSSILLTLALLGIFFEIKTPGFGAPGIIALIALALFFGSHSLIHLAGWGEIILFVIGVILLLVEIFLIPGFGITGTLGIIAIVASLYLSLVGRFFHPTDIFSGAKVLAISFISSFLIILIALRFLPKFTPVNRLVLKTTESVSAGFRSSPESYRELEGKTGIALTTLRPAGTALIEDEKLSVVTEGEFIEKNMKIRVKKIEGYRIVVERI
ncbi:MAG: nodulation protein NfeD [Candidatus Krumholzibacteriota bacterium]|nr:nodulation protein NfeD [Candidatus Krumholzibacteriota bacterium]